MYISKSHSVTAQNSLCEGGGNLVRVSVYNKYMHAYIHTYIHTYLLTYHASLETHSGARIIYAPPSSGVVVGGEGVISEELAC